MRCQSRLVIFVALCCSVGSAQDFSHNYERSDRVVTPNMYAPVQLRQRETIQVTY
jgi:hypothetical protein